MSIRTRFIMLWTIIGLLVVGAGVATVGALNDNLYSAQGTVRTYLEALGRGDAESALAMPGVASNSLEPSRRVLLQSGAFDPPRNIEVSSATVTGNTATVRATVTLGVTTQSLTFHLTRQPLRALVFDQWIFSRPPLGNLRVAVDHDTLFQVGSLAAIDINSYPSGLAQEFSASANFPVFVGASYATFRKSHLLSAPRAVTPISGPDVVSVPIDVQSTAEFQRTVQTAVNKTLTSCTEQTVLMPTGCPFGFTTQNRWVGPATWTIASYPDITIEPGSVDWRVRGTGTAHVTGSVTSLFDGSTQPIDTDVDFTIDAGAVVSADNAITFVG